MQTKLGEDVEQMLPGIAEVLSGGLAFASWVLDSKAALRERMGWLEMETRELMAPLLPEQGAGCGSAAGSGAAHSSVPGSFARPTHSLRCRFERRCSVEP